jgi:hypothetical protein
MMALFLCVLGLLGKETSLEVSGFVFADHNGNGIRDDQENGLPGIGVSDGAQIVLTDEKGQFFLETSPQHWVFVIKPRDYALPVNDQHLPLFYQKANGSSLSFPLLPKKEDDDFSIMVFGDPQPKTEREVDYLFRDVVSEWIGKTNAVFGVSLGDIVHDNLSLFPLVNEVQGKLGIPWHNVIGNHDLDFDAADDAGANATFEAIYGPTTYSANIGRVHFIVLDNVIYFGKDPSPRGYTGGFTPRQLTFLKQDLALVPPDHLILLAMHIPLFEEKAHDTFRDEDRERLFELLAPFPHTLSLSAHTHIQTQVFFSAKDGWKGPGEHHHFNVGATCGSWWGGEPDAEGIPHTTQRDGTPNGVLFLRILGGAYQVDFFPSREDASFQMRLSGAKAVRKGEYPNAPLVVNFFLGNEKTMVHYRLDEDAQWRKMRRREVLDPYLMALEVKANEAERPLPGPRLSGPIPSPHTWQMSLPTHLSEGEHVVHVRVTDDWGREYFNQFNYRIFP